MADTSSDLSGAQVEEAEQDDRNVWLALFSQEPQHVAFFIVNVITCIFGIVAMFLISFPDIQGAKQTIPAIIGLVVAVTTVMTGIFLPEEGLDGMQWMFVVLYSALMGYLFSKIWRGESRVVSKANAVAMGMDTGKLSAGAKRQRALEEAAVGMRGVPLAPVFPRTVSS